MQIVAIIPARGGSKGIPRKNVTLLAGKPLVAHSIEQAKQTPLVTRLVVSTDDHEIASVACEWGAEVVMRPTEISGDTATSESALLHVLDYFHYQASGQSPPDPDLVVFLQPTSPCRPPGDIQRAIDTLRREQADSLLSVGPVHGFVWRIEKDGSLRSFSYDHLNRPRRQDAPEDLIENGSIYVFKPWVLRQFNNRLGGKVALHRMSALDSFQIDAPGDFELLELIMAFRNRTTGPQNHWSTDQRGQLSVLDSQWSSIRLLVLDFDGVLTDSRVLVTEEGQEAVFCDRGDGMGIARLKQAGIEVLVISTESNPVVSARCQKLNVECIQGCDNKLAELKRKAENSWLKPDAIAYVGNDLNDLECLRWVGLPIAVGDAIPEVRAAAKWITSKPGGHGAVREVCDSLRKSKGSGP